ncbi:MAG: O-antigen ligase family protein [Thiomicrorhabdus sp.]|nr:O-antigen ligase family protein [Thiomicrorhabdus sp.]
MLSLFSKHALLLWLGVIFTASLFSVSNISGEGLDLPFNVMVWAFVCLFIVSTFIKGVMDKQIKWAGLVVALLVLLFGVLGVGAINANFSNDAFMQTAFNFSVIILFFLALFQYRFTQVQFIQLLIGFCVLGMLQSLIAIVQTHDVYRVMFTLVGYEPLRFNGAGPLGNFQQVNMLATFLAFSLVSSLYVVSTPFFLRSRRLAKIGLFLCILLCAYVLFLTGSRAGTLAWMIASSLMLMARYKALWQSRTIFLIWGLMLSLGFFLSVTFFGNASGLAQVVQKTAGMSEGLRLVVYQQSILLFMQSPLTGLGIGNFIEPFAAHIKEHDVTALQSLYWTHPHNELLYWMLQSGLIVLVLALGFVGYFLYVLFQSRTAFSLAILALIMPFAIQSQLSYPFSLSSVHLFIPLVLMYAGTRQYARAYHFSMPAWGQAGAIIALVGLTVVIVFATWHSLKSIKELYIFENSLFYTQFQTKEEIANQRYLQHATYNLLYREKVIQAMNAMVNKSIKTNNQYDLQQFIWWAQDRGGVISQQSLKNLAKVYLVQKKIKKIDEVAVQLLNAYGVVLNRVDLQKEIERIKAGDF